MKQASAHNVSIHSSMPLILFWLGGMVALSIYGFGALGVDMSGWELVALNLWMGGLVWKLAFGDNKACSTNSLKQVKRRVKRVLKAEMNYGSYDFLGRQPVWFSAMVRRTEPSCPIAYC